MTNSSENFMKIAKITIGLILLTSLFAAAAFAQAAAAQPKTDTLLNGLKVLMWPDNSASKIEIRVRVHSGAAFDPQGREGVMKLLTENLFPNDAARDYFREDLDGSLELRTTYDYIEVNATGRSDALLQMLETLSAAIENPVIDKEITAKLKTSLLEQLKKYEGDPAYVADRAIAKRLFGTFPYGRPVFGTPESVQKIDFADLIDAKERFLTADNATVTIKGNFDRSYGFKAARRLFGAWLKADKRVPSTFKQPDDPAAGIQMVASPRTDESEIRFAVRGVSRNTADTAAAEVFANVLTDRLKSRVPSEHANDVVVRSEEHTLPGIFIVSFHIKRGADDEKKLNATEIVGAALAGAVTDAEFAAARSRFAADWSKRSLTTFWLDADTYGTKVDDDMKAADSVTLAQVNAFAEKVRRSPMASVLVNTPPPAN